MIEEAKINYPLKTFQGVDTDLRYAIIMPNLSSEYCPSDKGKIKHVELKLGLVVPKPMQKSFLDHLEQTYSKEQCESVDWFKGKSRFTAKQASLVVDGKSTNVCNFNPYDVMSKDDEKIKASLDELFTNGSGYAKIFEEGKQYDITNSDMQHVIKFIKSGILDHIEKYQLVDQSDLDEITKLYQEVEAEDSDPKSHIMEYFESFMSHRTSDPDSKPEDPDSIAYKWRRVLDWVVAETIKDSSMMIKWLETESGVELLGIQIIDTDTKLCTKISTYQKEMLKFFKDYAEYLLNPEKYSNSDTQ